MFTLRLSIVFLLLSNTLVFSQTYFQQEVNYTINVKLNDKVHSLSGFETIEYINHSPDTLKFIYFHLWPNAYKNKNTALANQLLENGETNFHYAENDELGYIDSLNFKTGEEINLCSLQKPRRPLVILAGSMT